MEAAARRLLPPQVRFHGGDHSDGEAIEQGLRAGPFFVLLQPPVIPGKPRSGVDPESIIGFRALR